APELAAVAVETERDQPRRADDDAAHECTVAGRERDGLALVEQDARATDGIARMHAPGERGALLGRSRDAADATRRPTGVGRGRDGELDVGEERRRRDRRDPR